MKRKLHSQTTEKSKLFSFRNVARHRRKVGQNEQLVKGSEYAKEFMPKDSSRVPGTDFNIYDRPSASKNTWKSIDLPNEKSSAYKRQYPGAYAPSDKLAKDKDMRAGFKDRNGNIIGNSYATMENTTQVKRSFLSPEPNLGSKLGNRNASGASSRLGSERSIGVKFPYGYRSALDGKTTYKDNFVDFHVKHCHCVN